MTENPNEKAVKKAMEAKEPHFEIVPADAGLAPSAAQSLAEAFKDYFDEAEAMKALAESVTEPKAARKARLQIKNLRVAAEKKLLEARLEALAPYGTDTQYLKLDEIPEELFQKLLAEEKADHEARLEAERKTEEERQARIAAEKAEQDRIRKENERLKAEAEAREKAEAEERKRVETERKAAEEKARKEREALEAKARAEREAMEAQAKKEREAREKAEAELRAKEEAERKRIEEEKRIEAERIANEEKARKAAAKAPDKQKFKSFAASVSHIDVPEMKTAEGKKAAAALQAKLTEIKAMAEDSAANL